MTGPQLNFDLLSCRYSWFSSSPVRMQLSLRSSHFLLVLVLVSLSSQSVKGQGKCLLHHHHLGGQFPLGASDTGPECSTCSSTTQNWNQGPCGFHCRNVPEPQGSQSFFLFVAERLVQHNPVFNTSNVSGVYFYSHSLNDLHPVVSGRTAGFLSPLNTHIQYITIYFCTYIMIYLQIYIHIILYMCVYKYIFKNQTKLDVVLPRSLTTDLNPVGVITATYWFHSPLVCGLCSSVF